MRNWYLAAALLFLFFAACKEAPPTSENTLLRPLDTVLEGRLYEEIAIPNLNLEATPLTATNHLMLRQGRDTLTVTPIDTGIAFLKSWGWDGKDTLVRISLRITADSVALALKRSLDTVQNNSFISLDSTRMTLLHTRAVNKPFPETMPLREAGKKTAFSTKLLQDKVSVIDCWFMGCLGCMLVINDLQTTIPEFRDEKKVQFLSFFRDSVYVAEGKAFFETRYYNGAGDEHEADTSLQVSFLPFSYPSRHFFGLQRYEGKLPVPGYPVVFITDRQGVIRYVLQGGYPGIGADIARQVRLFQGFAGEGQ